MYEFFGGVTPILVPDNASTAVDHNNYDWYSPKLIRVYHEMAEHYNTAIIPARIRRPKDKPIAEGTVGNISTWITAALRNDQFFSLYELNQAIREKLKKYNANPFQKKEGSRLSIFLGEEKPLLAPLPATRFELATWKQATVQFNYHIAVDKMFYSVPYQYIKEKVDVRITDSVVEVYSKNERIASHRRLTGRPGQYSTQIDHMPKDHQQYLEWNGDRFRRWAKEVGPNTYKVIDAILASNKIEQQTYRSCMGIIRLADKHTKVRLEAVCRKALTYSGVPSYKGIKNLFATLKAEDLDEYQEKPKKRNPYGLTRGADYYGGKNDATE
jgi:transposase